MFSISCLCICVCLLGFGQYELLDEMMDFGYPQYTEAKILSEFIKTDAYRMEVMQRPPMAVTNAVSWRSEGIRYKKNEVGYSLTSLNIVFCSQNGMVIVCEEAPLL